MRIAVVSEYYRPTLGGVQEHVFHFAREARAQGHEVTVVTSRVPGPHAEQEPGVVRLGESLCIEANGSIGRVTVGTGLGRELRELLTDERFDVVHLHAPLSPVLPVLANRATRLPLVGTYHTNFPKSRAMQLARVLCQGLVDRIDVNVAVSDVCIRALSPYVRADFKVIPNGVDVAAWARGQPMPELRREGPVVLFVGRLEPRSGFERLIAAWPVIREKHDPLLVVVGDGPERARFEALAAAARVRTRFLGARWADRPDIFASADVLACPTHIASFGITLLEGMAAGLPIVASDIDGFREVLTSGREGLLVDSADPGSFGDALAAMLDDPTAARVLGSEGRRTAQRYDWPEVTRSVIGVYRALGVA